MSGYAKKRSQSSTSSKSSETSCISTSSASIRPNEPEVAQARQIAMYLAKQHTKSPLIAIGSAIGGRNHATVLHSCKAVSNQIETDKAFQRQMEELEKLVLA